MRPLRPHRMALLPALLLALSGCAAAVGAAAGVGAMEYIESQTATATSDASLAEVGQWTQQAFRTLGVTLTDTDIETDEREYEGEDGDLKVQVKLERDAGRTAISVVAAENYVDYERDYAERVLASILRRGR